MLSTGFWSSVILTGNQTCADARLVRYLFWSSVILTGNQTRAFPQHLDAGFGAVSF